VPIRARTFLILAALLLLAATLVELLPGDAVARAMFQSSPPGVEFTATPTLIPTVPAIATPIPSPTLPALKSQLPTPTTLPLGATVLPPAIATAVAQSTLAPTATPPEALAVPNYLPPPTLTAPSAFANGHGLSQLTGPRTSPAQSGAAAQPQAAPVLAAESQTAQLIDNLVSLLSYGWLCCGSVLLVLIAVGFVWLARRKPAG
jgi:hypothetical protein